MSGRISVYAVDLPGFDKILDERTIGEILVELAQTPVELARWPSDEGKGHDPDLFCLSAWYKSAEYYSFPGRMFTIERDSRRTIEDIDRNSEPFRQKVRAYLNESPWGGERLLEALSICPNIDSVRMITKGHKRWWVPPFLSFAKNEPSIDAKSYECASLLFKKLVHDWEIDVELPPIPEPTIELSFPVIDCD